MAISHTSNYKLKSQVWKSKNWICLTNDIGINECVGTIICNYILLQ